MSEPQTTDLLASSGWRLYRSEPGAVGAPADLAGLDAVANPPVATTVAASLFSALDDWYHPPFDTDDFDWWYQCDLAAPPGGLPALLACDGLATIAEVWIGDECVLTSTNMFVAHRLELTQHLGAPVSLTIAFRSLNAALRERRPRGRWKTNLVSAQQLRWFRTTLLGRMPGWTPPVRCVGPWRGVRVSAAALIRERCIVRPLLIDGTGRVEIDAVAISAASLADASAASLTIGGRRHALRLHQVGGRLELSGTIDVGEVDAWQPHTAGAANLYDYSIEISNAGTETTLAGGRIGFRDVRFDAGSERPAFTVNGRETFCRGFCWSSADLLGLDADASRLRAILTTVRESGANMLRIGGTMVYESDTFYELCDELGIMVWQDFMFANMDYPSDDDAFLASVRLELTQQVQRLSAHPSVVCFCGNSEVEQQAAMFGQTDDVWRNALFYAEAPEIVAAHSSDTPYVPASPTGGALPFHNDTGVSHYFGVGAYRRGLDDVDRHPVLFASECLGFSNLPSADAISGWFGSLTPAPHSPSWKAGVPRDAAASWDFEDVRDTYLEALYAVPASSLRQSNPSRYFDLSAVVSGEVMQSVFERWMHPQNACSGGLIWFLMDLVPGAGWGMLDSDGRRKPLYYFLRRAWSTRGVAWRDNGLQGLVAELRNDDVLPLQGRLRVQILQHSKTLIRECETQVDLPAGSRSEVAIDRELGQFFDTTYSYRFGPPKHDVVVASLLDADDRTLQVAAYFPNDRDLAAVGSATIETHCETNGDTASLTIQSDAFLQSVCLKARDFEFEDNYFHVAPGTPMTVHARRAVTGERALSGTLTALNLDAGRRFS